MTAFQGIFAPRTTLAIVLTTLAVGCNGAETSSNDDNIAAAGITAGASAAGMTAANSGSGALAGTGSLAGVGAVAGSGATAGTTAGTGAGTGAAGQMPMVVGDPGACEGMIEGVYAMKVELDVWFMDEVNDPKSPLADPGRGKVELWFRGELSDLSADGATGKAVIHPCGSELPAILVSANCGAIGIQFPDALWDKPSVPSYETKGSVTGFGVGDILTFAKTAGLLGLSLPKGAPFPTYEQTASFTCAEGTGAQCFLDQDADGNPGITVTMRPSGTVDGPYACNAVTSGFKFFGAPLSLLGGTLPSDSTYAKEAYIGLLTDLGGSGKVREGCTQGVGAADTGDSLPSRVLDCVRRNGQKCSATEAAFVDQNTPRYHIMKAGDVPPPAWKHNVAASDAKLDRTPSEGPKSSVVRIGDLGSSFTCDKIRMASFPAFD